MTFNNKGEVAMKEITNIDPIGSRYYVRDNAGSDTATAIAQAAKSEVVDDYGPRKEVGIELELAGNSPAVIRLTYWQAAGIALALTSAVSDATGEEITDVLLDATLAVKTIRWE